MFIEEVTQRHTEQVRRSTLVIDLLTATPATAEQLTNGMLDGLRHDLTREINDLGQVLQTVSRECERRKL